MTMFVRNFIMIIAALGALADDAQSQDATVFAANYDIEFSVDDQAHSVQSRALVRSGNEIPIFLQKFKLGLRVSEADSDGFSIQVMAYEKNGSAWHQITVPPQKFSGKLGVPTEYAWESDEIRIDLAIVIGIHRQ